VQRVHPVSEFKRANETYGKVRRLQLRDETGQVIVVFWNQKVDELGNVETGDNLRIMNARVKELAGGLVELHVEKATQIEKVTEKLPSFEQKKRQTIADIKEEGGPFTIEATIVSTPKLREVTTSQNEKVKVTSFSVSDTTGEITVSVWREHAESARNLSLGTRVLFRNIHAKRGFSDQLELTTRASTKIRILSGSE